MPNLMQPVRESVVRSPGGRHETVTLQAETMTPRRRTTSASFERDCTPFGEMPLARRQRLKNVGKARARALVRLDPVKHKEYLEAERARKKQRTHTVEAVSHVEPTSPAWKQQARERVAAEAAETQERRDERATRAQEARVQRAAVTGSHRCGSCATCAELEMFGGMLWVKHGKPCETVLQQLDYARKSDATVVGATSRAVCASLVCATVTCESDGGHDGGCDETVRNIAWEDLCAREC